MHQVRIATFGNLPTKIYQLNVDISFVITFSKNYIGFLYYNVGNKILKNCLKTTGKM